MSAMWNVKFAVYLLEKSHLQYVKLLQALFLSVFFLIERVIFGLYLKRPLEVGDVWHFNLSQFRAKIDIDKKA